MLSKLLSVTAPEIPSTSPHPDIMDEFESPKKVCKMDKLGGQFACDECSLKFKCEASFGMHNALKHHIVDEEDDDDDIQFGVDSHISKTVRAGDSVDSCKSDKAQKTVLDETQSSKAD